MCEEIMPITPTFTALGLAKVVASYCHLARHTKHLYRIKLRPTWEKTESRGWTFCVHMYAETRFLFAIPLVNGDDYIAPFAAPS